MPITWRNLGQSSNSGNILIAGASDTITQGIDSLQSAAQSVTDEQNRQYQTQADVNTANILTDIGRLDQEGVDSFDVAALNKQFGSQFDSAGIADALDARVGSLREAAQQEADNTNRDLITNSRLETDELQRTNLTGQIGAREDAKQKADKFNKFNREVTGDIGSYNNQEDLKRKITKAGQAAGMLPEEIQKSINVATNTFNNNIAIQAPQQALLDQRAAEQAQVVNQSVAFQNNALDNAARNRGIIPELVDLHNTPDGKGNTVGDIVDTYQNQVAESGSPFKEDSVVAFKSLLDTQLNEAGLSNSNAAELNHFISLGFDEGGFFTDDGLNYDKVKAKVTKYAEMLKDREGINTYNKSKAAIQQGALDTAKAQAKDIARYGRMMLNDNRVDFTGKGQRFDEIIPKQLRRDRLDKALLTTDWFK